MSSWPLVVMRIVWWWEGGAGGGIGGVVEHRDSAVEVDVAQRRTCAPCMCALGRSAEATVLRVRRRWWR